MEEFKRRSFFKGEIMSIDWTVYLEIGTYRGQLPEYINIEKIFKSREDALEHIIKCICALTVKDAKIYRACTLKDDMYHDDFDLVDCIDYKKFPDFENL